MRISFSDRQILLDGTPDLLLGGEFQYFRIDPELWRPALTAFKDAGLNVISAYVPWVWHEVEEGHFDFTGRTHPGRDLVRFIELAGALELPLVLKPGPFIFAEYQGFGVPLWLATRHPEVLMAVHKPQRFPQPSLNDPGYLILVRRWFEAVAVVLRPHVESGGVVAIQIDNETGYPQFGQGPHLTDRNPSTLALLREALAQRFGTVDALNAAWGTRFASFDALEPPLERHYSAGMLDTMARFVEDYIVSYLAKLAAMWREIGLDTFYFLNDIWLDAWPSHLGKKNAVAPLAYDLYPRYSELPVTFDQPYSIAYVPKLFGAFLRSGPLICAELGAGWLDPACEVRPEATWLSTMAGFAHGTRACFYYILMDGQDPDGDYVFRSFLGIQGEELPRMAVARRAARFCKLWGKRVAASEECSAPVAILHSPAITREMMSAALDPVGMLVSGSQRAVDEALTIVSVNAGLYGALVEAGYSADVLNLERATQAELEAYPVVFFNSIGVADAASQAKLLAYVEAGGHLVTLGTPFAHASPLFPARVVAVANPQAWLVLGRVAWDYAKLYWRIARDFGHRLCAYTIEGMFPAMLMTRHATRSGRWLKLRDRTRLWASRLVTLSQLEPGVTQLMRMGRGVAGYEARHGLGLSVFVGTLLGATFDSPGYYLDDPERKRSVTAYLGSLLGGWGLAPHATPTSGLETVMREGPGFRLAFIFNRGASLAYDLALAGAWDGWQLTDHFAEAGSSLRWEAGRLTGRLAADDVVCAYWERP